MTNLLGNTPLPVAGLQPVVNVRHNWVALAFQLPINCSAKAVLPLLAGEQGLFEAVGGLPVIIPCADPFAFLPSEVEHLPNGRLILAIPAARCSITSLDTQLRNLQVGGVRCLVEGCVPPELELPKQVLAMVHDCGSAYSLAAAKETMRKLSGLHVARRVDTRQQFDECKAAGFSWFMGDYLLQTAGGEGTSRTRLLKLLALIGRDAEARELEALLKQDLALSFHLLKLVNSAAFAPSNPITSFTQAINVLGRRQLQRWLQLLLYARTDDGIQSSPLLPLAALRASLMEGLCKAAGGDQEMQEKAFMVGMFSLLAVALSTALDEVIVALKLDASLVDALLHKRGHLGALLKLVEDASRGNVIPDLASCEISAEQYWPALMKAFRWASVVMQEA